MATELKHTVKPSGGDYTTLDAAIDHLVAAHANLVTADVYATIEIDGTWSSADTAAVTIAGLTTDATRYLHIYTTAAARHQGAWSTSYYQLVTSNATALTITTAHDVRIDGLQIGKSSSSANGQAGIELGSGITPGSNYWISNCIIKQAGNALYREPGIACGDADITLYAWNDIIYGLGAADNSLNSAFYGYRGTLNIYSSICIGGKYGVYAGGTSVVAKNVYAGGTITEDFFLAAGTLDKTNCASEDQSADDAGGSETATNCVAAAVLIDTDTFVNVTGGSEDFHLAADGLSPLVGVGVNTSGDSAPLDFSTDIDGDTRDATWDIGVDAWVVSAPSGMVNDLVIIFEC